jgi:hypothetical protein
MFSDFSDIRDISDLEIFRGSRGGGRVRSVDRPALRPRTDFHGRFGTKKQIGFRVTNFAASASRAR